MVFAQCASAILGIEPGCECVVNVLRLSLREEWQGVIGWEREYWWERNMCCHYANVAQFSKIHKHTHKKVSNPLHERKKRSKQREKKYLTVHTVPPWSPTGVLGMRNSAWLQSSDGYLVWLESYGRKMMLPYFQRALHRNTTSLAHTSPHKIKKALDVPHQTRTQTPAGKKTQYNSTRRREL